MKLRALVLVFSLVVVYGAPAAASDSFGYSGKATYDGQSATLELRFTGSAVTGTLRKDGECKTSLRLTRTELFLTGTLSGPWEGTGTILGTWVGGDSVCGRQLTLKDGYPQKGAFRIDLEGNMVVLERTSPPHFPTGWRYEFRASGHVYAPAGGTAGSQNDPCLPVGVGITCQESSGQACTLYIASHDVASGAVDGWIEWPALGSKNHIRGKYEGTTLTFVEDHAIVAGRASLACQYTLVCKDGALTGTYDGCATGPRSGTLSLTLPAVEGGPTTLDISSLIGTELACSESSGEPCTLFIASHDAGNGAIEGWISWPRLGSKNHILGHADDTVLTFNEDRAIQSGRASLGCSYTLHATKGGLEGSYAGCVSGPPTGSFSVSTPSAPH